MFLLVYLCDKELGSLNLLKVPHYKEWDVFYFYYKKGLGAMLIL